MSQVPLHASYLPRNGHSNTRPLTTVGVQHIMTAASFIGATTSSRKLCFLTRPPTRHASTLLPNIMSIKSSTQLWNQNSVIASMLHSQLILLKMILVILHHKDHLDPIVHSPYLRNHHPLRLSLLLHIHLYQRPTHHPKHLNSITYLLITSILHLDTHPILQL